MKRPKLLAACLFLGVLLAGCGPSITVTNNTGFAIRAVVTSATGSEVVSPTPGNSSTVDADTGNYTVTAIPDADWVAYAQTVRKLLNEQLANSDSLTGQQLLDVIQRLKNIAAKMQQFASAAGKGASCSGAITENGGGTVVVGLAADGSLAVGCS
jgi:hypothetical protein